MNQRYRQWPWELSWKTRDARCQQQKVSDEPVESDDWSREITTYLRRVIQQCVGATIEYRRSDRSLHFTMRGKTSRLGWFRMTSASATFIECQSVSEKG